MRAVATRGRSSHTRVSSCMLDPSMAPVTKTVEACWRAHTLQSRIDSKDKVKNEEELKFFHDEYKCPVPGVCTHPNRRVGGFVGVGAGVTALYR